MDFNDQDVTIECQKCKGEIIVNILEITNHHTIICPTCGVKNDLSVNDSSAKLGIPKTYMPFEGLGDYIQELENKRKKN